MENRIIDLRLQIENEFVLLQWNINRMQLVIDKNEFDCFCLWAKDRIDKICKLKLEMDVLVCEKK